MSGVKGDLTELTPRAVVRLALQNGAQEALLQPGYRPMLVIDGKVMESQAGALGPEGVRLVFQGLAGDRQRQEFEEEGQTSFFTKCDAMPVRVSACRALGEVTLMVTLEPSWLSFSEAAERRLQEWFGTPGGLCVFLGPPQSETGQAVLAALQRLAGDIGRRIMVVSQGFLPPFDGPALVARRRIGEDVASYSNAVDHALRAGFDTMAFSHPEDAALPAALRAALAGMKTLVALTAKDVDAALSVIRTALRQHDRPELADAIPSLRILFCRVSRDIDRLCCEFVG